MKIPSMSHDSKQYINVKRPTALKTATATVTSLLNTVTLTSEEQHPVNTAHFTLQTIKLLQRVC